METPIEKASPRDVFDLMKIEAGQIDAAGARRDPGERGKFIARLVENLKAYRASNGIEKPEGYYGIFKTVVSGRTNEFFKMLEACKSDNFEEFTQQVQEADRETLRRMGKLDLLEKPSSDAVSAQRRVTFEAILASTDVREDAVRRRDWNPQTRRRGEGEQPSL